MPRQRLFTLRCSDEERKRLELVGAHYGLTVAGLLRMLVKREADALEAARPLSRGSSRRA